MQIKFWKCHGFCDYILKNYVLVKVGLQIKAANYVSKIRSLELSCFVRHHVASMIFFKQVQEEFELLVPAQFIDLCIDKFLNM